jgi:hypothetical protein
MKRMTRRDFAALATAAVGLGIRPSHAAPKPRMKSSVLFIGGQNNHDWDRTSPLLQGILNDSGLFDLTVSLTPPKGSAPEDWNAWRPDFGAYDVVFLDYNGEMWPEEVRTDFAAYIRGGGSALAQHAANNPFTGWTEFEEMIGLLWRNADFGERLYLDEQGNEVRVPAGEGPGAGHGRLHDWQITTRDPDHPIMQGVPEVWLHSHDELYHGQRGPARNMNILASAYSSPESGGTGEHEPVIWWIPYGEGKVLTFLPGHLWGGQEDETALHCVGLRTLLQRSTEWLATGDVTLPIPDDFPGPDRVSIKAM